jgi:hypothetical protein
MSFDQQLSHLAAMDAALTTLTAGVHALDCGPAAVQALVTLAIAIAEARLVLTEQLMTWLGNHYDAPEARAVLTAARATLASARFGVDAIKAAELRAAERLN